VWNGLTEVCGRRPSEQANMDKTKGLRAGLWTENQNLELVRIVRQAEDRSEDGGPTGPFWEWTETQNLALVKIVKKVEDRADGGPTGTFWELVLAAMEAEKVRPGTKAGTRIWHYHALVAGLEKHLPAGEFESLDDQLKTKGSRLVQVAPSPSPAGASIDAPEQTEPRERAAGPSGPEDGRQHEHTHRCAKRARCK
jgi:hypothetical protein